MFRVQAFGIRVLGLRVQRSKFRVWCSRDLSLGFEV